MIPLKRLLPGLFYCSARSRLQKVPPSQQNRRKEKPKLTPASEYTPHTYAHAVRVAAKKAKVPHWHPNQLRHTFASDVRKQHGLEAAQVLLGHLNANVTQVYAERSVRWCTGTRLAMACSGLM